MAREGLRTLVVAKRVLTEDQYQDFEVTRPSRALVSPWPWARPACLKPEVLWPQQYSHSPGALGSPHTRAPTASSPLGRGVRGGGKEPLPSVAGTHVSAMTVR